MQLIDTILSLNGNSFNQWQAIDEVFLNLHFIISVKWTTASMILTMR